MCSNWIAHVPAGLVQMSFFGVPKQQFLTACRYVTSGIKKVFNMPNTHSRVLTNIFNQQLVHMYHRT